ncbi:MAG: bifunctional folylpolyglutamate synthase/dihydrofolate synthase [Eubacteriales bacterium]|nr:bifunctional folylpolyglutamate synthase/dihydrofolate synthase [Eubacteriales bacterium]
MTALEAIEYIENCGWSKTRLGLERTRELLKGLKNPQDELKFVHVAGTNGKGSTCAMLESILRRAGYKTGLFTSPPILDFCEQIRINGENITDTALADITARVKLVAERMDDHPSRFELLTAVAMEYFRESRCDIVVLEVGMGGALDATNVIHAPEAGVITNIGLEHTEYLGSTLEEIAAAKAGIIKPGCSCICYDGAAEVTAVIRKVCAEQNVPLKCADFSKLTLLLETLNGQSFLWEGKEYRLSLNGRHQRHNAAVVLETVAALRERGWQIGQDAVTKGLASVEWPARMEILSKKPLFILDGGHNPQCAKALAESLKALLPNPKAVFLIGVLANKDYPKIIRELLPFAQEFICLTPLNDGALPAEKLADYLATLGAKATVGGSVEDGIKAALAAAGDAAVVCFGSLYMVGHVKAAFPGVYDNWLRGKRGLLS